MLLSGLILLLVCFASNFLLMEIYLNGILAHELKKPHTAYRFNVVSRRHLRLSARRMDLPRTGMETPYPESHYRSIVTRIFFLSPTPEAYNKVSPLFSGLYFVDSLFLVALYRTVQGRKTGLTNKKIKDLKLKD